MLLSHSDASYAARGGCRPRFKMDSNMNAKHTSRASLRTAGFSLIEILIVVAIGFIMAAVAIPQALGAYRTYKLNNAATEVAGIVKLLAWRRFARTNRSGAADGQRPA